MTTKALGEFVEELDGFVRTNRDLLNEDERIRRPIAEALEAARTKYDDRVREGRR